MVKVFVEDIIDNGLLTESCNSSEFCVLSTDKFYYLKLHDRTFKLLRKILRELYDPTEE